MSTVFQLSDNVFFFLGKYLCEYLKNFFINMENYQDFIHN